MTKKRAKKIGPYYLTGLISASVVGVAGYVGNEERKELARERLEVVEDSKTYVSEYLASLPGLIKGAKASIEEKNAEIAYMESRLGELCLQDMLTNPETFDEALSQPFCDRFTPQQLNEAEVYYNGALTAVETNEQHLALMTDDPNNQTDTVDILQTYVANDTPAQMPSRSVEISEPIDTVIIPPKVVSVVVDVGPTKGTKQIELPRYEQPSMPYKWLLLGSLAAMVFIYSGTGVLKDLLRRWTDKKLANKEKEDITREIVIPNIRQIPEKFEVMSDKEISGIFRRIVGQIDGQDQTDDQK